uniref:Uncharacterized protein n=1 Tax=Glossina pallidipes TaxID=7398 RepID=A0A1B0AK01_GLOPL
MILMKILRMHPFRLDNPPLAAFVHHGSTTNKAKNIKQTNTNHKQKANYMRLNTYLQMFEYHFKDPELLSCFLLLVLSSKHVLIEVPLFVQLVALYDICLLPTAPSNPLRLLSHLRYGPNKRFLAPVQVANRKPYLLRLSLVHYAPTSLPLTAIKYSGHVVIIFSYCVCLCNSEKEKGNELDYNDYIVLDTAVGRQNMYKRQEDDDNGKRAKALENAATISLFQYYCARKSIRKFVDLKGRPGLVMIKRELHIEEREKDHNFKNIRREVYKWNLLKADSPAKE